MKHPLRLCSLALLTLLAALTVARAYNPFLPGYEYIPDGEPRVFGDRLYLYGSHDRASGDAYCDYQYRVWSAPLADPAAWTDHGVSFSTRDQEGHKADVPYSKNRLYAPDLIENHGKYWLYAYVVGAPCAVGVSDHPAGPFKFVSKINAPAGSNNEFGGWGQYIDPGVLVDDDGRVYIYWGYKRSGMAELDAKTMVDVLPGTLINDIIPVEAPFKFFEGCSPRKINGVYYMVYAAGDSLVYATANKPTGPFNYRGAIIRNRGDNPGGNIHGGLVQVNGQWYITYHRQSHNAEFSRRACAERVTIEADGTIKEVEQTSLGFKDSLNPSVTVPADVTCVLRGGPYVMEFDYNTRAVINTKNGAVVGYKYFEFGPKERPLKLHAELRDHGQAGTLEVWLDAPSADNGRRIGTVTIEPTKKDARSYAPGDGWRTITVPVEKVGGRHALFFRFVSAAGTPTNTSLADFRSFSFAKR